MRISAFPERKFVCHWKPEKITVHLFFPISSVCPSSRRKLRHNRSLAYEEGENETCAQAEFEASHLTTGVWGRGSTFTSMFFPGRLETFTGMTASMRSSRNMTRRTLLPLGDQRRKWQQKPQLCGSTFSDTDVFQILNSSRRAIANQFEDPPPPKRN
ncbi:bis(5'-adenosyl)-triphosphatase isoform X6 [Gorilla gorilla gorilla]|uniref:bis(5'-adenosyl)-triphosphatase isoform X6 n=1 Tax=Gorilla gorilla gorilla TaxID=9595 RepID=UPI00300B369A